MLPVPALALYDSSEATCAVVIVVPTAVDWSPFVGSVHPVGGVAVTAVAPLALARERFQTSDRAPASLLVAAFAVNVVAAVVTTLIAASTSRLIVSPAPGVNAAATQAYLPAELLAMVGAVSPACMIR